MMFTKALILAAKLAFAVASINSTSSGVYGYWWWTWSGAYPPSGTNLGG